MENTIIMIPPIFVKNVVIPVLRKVVVGRFVKANPARIVANSVNTFLYIIIPSFTHSL